MATEEEQEEGRWMMDGEKNVRLTGDRRVGGVELGVEALESCAEKDITVNPEKQRRVLLTRRTLLRIGTLGMLSSVLTLVGGIFLCVSGLVPCAPLACWFGDLPLFLPLMVIFILSSVLFHILFKISIINDAEYLAPDNQYKGVLPEVLVYSPHTPEDIIRVFFSYVASFLMLLFLWLWPIGMLSILFKLVYIITHLNH